MHACIEGARRALTIGGSRLRVNLFKLGQEGSDSMLHLDLFQCREAPSLSSDLLQRSTASHSPENAGTTQPVPANLAQSMRGA